MRTAGPFTDSRAHLLAELARIDLLVRLEVARAREVAVADEQFQGLCVTEDEVDDLLRRSAGLPTWATTPDSPEAVSVREEVGRLAEEHRDRAGLCARAGTRLRLADLAERLGLSAFDVDVVLVALAPEIDPRYGRLYAYLQDDIARRRPSVDLVTNLLCACLEDKLAARERLSPRAPLRARGVLVLSDHPHDHAPGLLNRELAADGRVVDYLLGFDQPPEDIARHVRWSEPADGDGEAAPGDGEAAEGYGEAAPGDGGAAADNGDLPLDDIDLDRLRRWLDGDARSGAGVVHLQGPDGADKLAAAASLCAGLGIPLLRVEGDRLRAAAGNGFPAAVQAVLREAALYDAALYWDGFDDLLGQGAGGADELRAVLDGVSERTRPTFLAGARAWEPAEAHRDLPCVTVPLAPPGPKAREARWRRALAGEALAAGVDLPELAGAFRLGAAEIRDAAATACRLARWRGGGGEPVARADLEEACRRHSDRSLADLAQHVPATRTWDDLVLPEEPLEQLRDLCARVRHRARVHDGWGFRAKVSQGDGLTALFAGPPGTGKTMSAQVVARELGYELYTVDLSTVVSKYIGETEKNLAQVFDAAERGNALLFFDEADALFGKRSEVRDARDRFANIEVSYLLQRMEQHEGVTILATNMRNNIDAAFLRRLAFVIQFPFPDEPTRLRIWEGVWPAEAPMGPDVDLPALAGGYELSGGNIRNIALSAAFLAVDEDAPVGMDHLLRATRREQRNLGKVAAGDRTPPRRAAARGGNGRAQGGAPT